MGSEINDYPYVSVIIPVYNDSAELSETLTALDRQTYPAAHYEVFVIDNGSTDTTLDVAKSFPGVQVLIEDRRLSSPYSARNRGIEMAKGEVIVFLDASCQPVPQWLEAGVKALNRENADMVGGKVAFRFIDSRSAGEFYDSQINIKMKENIEQKKGAKTANLFIHRRVIETIGRFPEGIRSGGDLLWTQKATREGFILVYDENAAVAKAARPLRELLKKQWRVGKRHPQIWREHGVRKSSLKIFLKMLVPPSPGTIQKMIQSRRQQGTPSFLSLWVVAYLVKIITSSANIYGKWKL